MDAWFDEWFDEDYATLYAHRDAAEAALAVKTALRHGPELAQGPVLDVACGSGRHLQALRKHNPEAFGLDLSSCLLGRAPEPLRPWLVRGDMRTLPVRPGCLAGITLWFTSFGFFPDAVNRRVLIDLRQLLRPGGVLLLDLFNPHQLVRELVAVEATEQPDLKVRTRRSLEDSRVVKRMTLIRESTGRSREVVERVRIYPPDTLDGMAAEAGMVRSKTWGTYDGTPFQPDRSPRWIALYKVNP